MELWRAIQATKENGSTMMKFTCECAGCDLKMGHECEEPEPGIVFKMFESMANYLMGQGWEYRDSKAYCPDCVFIKNGVEKLKFAAQLHSQKG